MRMLNVVWWTWLLKAVELVETAFFLLRKKYNQVSKLHVYHHTSTFLLGWAGVKYVGGAYPHILTFMVHNVLWSSLPMGCNNLI